MRDIELKVGDVFKWVGYTSLYQVTAVRDSGIKVEFRIIRGPKKGSVGYTLLPQDIVKVTPKGF